MTYKKLYISYYFKGNNYDLKPDFSWCLMSSEYYVLSDIYSIYSVLKEAISSQYNIDKDRIKNEDIVILLIKEFTI